MVFVITNIYKQGVRTPLFNQKNSMEQPEHGDDFCSILKNGIKAITRAKIVDQVIRVEMLTLL